MASRADGVMATDWLHDASYLAAGEAGALPLVLIHGFLGGAAQWEAEIEAFSGERRVLAFDLPGFAGAADQTPCTSIAQFADAVVSRLDAMQVERFVLLGHSMGGMIVQEIAARFPGRVAKLMLYGTGPLGHMPHRFEPLEASRQRLRAEGIVRSTERIVATWFVEGNKAEGYQRLTSIGSAANPEAAEAAILAMADWDGRENLRHVLMPTLILWGDSDRSYRWPQVELLWRDIPHASLAVLPGTSHAAHLEKPRLFHAIVHDFLTSVSTPKGAESQMHIGVQKPG
ncbi:MAG: alpha/beta hydrolase [Pseudomonadota bacterium]